MPASQNNSCTIINNTGKDAVVLMTTGQHEKINKDTVAASNEQFNLLRISGEKSILKNGESGTVNLDSTETDENGTDENVSHYDLIVADSNWLYPLAVMPVKQQEDNGAFNFANQTADADSKIAVDQAAAFYQAITAFPDSILTNNYTQALRKAKINAIEQADGSEKSSAAIAAAVSETMNGFFASTEKYKKVNLQAIVAIDNYYNSFPAVWAGFKSNATLYLYSSDGNTGGFAGILTISKTGTTDISKASGGYTCKFIPALKGSAAGSKAVDDNNAVDLVYADGLFTSDPGNEKPQIVLKGSFMLKRFFSKNSKDNSVITVLAGNIKGQVCVGFNASQSSVPRAALASSGSNPVTDYFDSITHPKTEKQLIISLLTLAFAILLIPSFAFAVYGIYKLVSARAGRNRATTKKEIEDALNESPDYEGPGAYSKAKLSGYKLFQDNEGALPPFNFDKLSDEARGALAMGEAVTLMGGIDSHETAVRELMKYRSLLSGEDFASLQRVSKLMSGASLELSRAISKGAAAAEEAYKKAFVDYKEHAGEFQEIFNQASRKLTTDARQSIEESLHFSAQIYEALSEEMLKDEEERMRQEPEVEEEIGPFGF